VNIQFTSAAFLVVIGISPSSPANKFAHSAPADTSIIRNGARHVHEIALTFDACSPGRHPGFDRRVISVLESTQTPATLFLGGLWMIRYPSVTRRLAASPLFEIGNHTYSHPHLSRISAASLLHQIGSVDSIFHSLTGRTMGYFRPPYGELTDSVVNAAASFGLTTVLYDLPSGDPDTTFTAERLVSWVSRKARNGSIIVMHMNGRGWHTAEALPTIIANLRARGFRFVTVGRLQRE